MRRLKNRLKSLETARIAIIGGSGLENLFKNAKRLSLETSYGTASSLLFTKNESKNVIFLPRHGPEQNTETFIMCRVFRVSTRICTSLEKVLIETIRGLPLKIKATCYCAKATKSARFT